MLANFKNDIVVIADDISDNVGTFIVMNNLIILLKYNLLTDVVIREESVM